MSKPFSLYFRDDTQTWWVNIPLKPLTGQEGRKRLNTYCADKFDGPSGGGAPGTPGANTVATQLYAETRASVAKVGAARVGVDLSLDRLIEMYKDQRLPELAAGKNEFFSSHAKSALKRIQRYFADVKAITADAWLNKKRTAGVMRRMAADGYSYATIRNDSIVLRAFLEYAHDAGAIDAVPHIETPTPTEVKSTKRFRRAMTLDEAERFLAWVKQKDEKAWRAYTVMFFTAMRKGEVGKLTRRWLDLQTAFMEIPASATKNKERRELWMLDRVASAINEQIRETANIDPDAPIFGKFNYYKLFWRGIKALGIEAKGLTAHHIARHSCATWVGQTALTVDELRASTGHKDLRVLQDTYFHKDGKNSRAAFSRILPAAVPPSAEERIRQLEEELAALRGKAAAGT